MPISTKMQKLIWGRFAGLCAICRERLVYDGKGSGTLLGEVAHIVGEKHDAARGNSALTEEERNAEDNLLLLCRPHHKIIDDRVDDYPVELLKGIRSDFLNWLQTTLTPAKPWEVKISSFAYLNVPRLVEYAAVQGRPMSLSNRECEGPLSDLGYSLVHLMVKFEAALSDMHIKSIPVEELPFVHEGYMGELVSFSSLAFRTRNIPIGERSKHPTQFYGDLSRDPHIYHVFKDWKFVLNIDPLWITTSTAYSMFRPAGGRSVFSGFARIHSLDYEERTMTGSSLALGTPKSWIDDVSWT